MNEIADAVIRDVPNGQDHPQIENPDHPGPSAYLIDAYQCHARTFSLGTVPLPDSTLSKLIYPVIALGEEAGELNGIIKRVMRDGDGEITEEDRAAIKKEMGDVLWYLSEIASELKIDMSEVTAANLEKLEGRLKRNTIQGKGHNR